MNDQTERLFEQAMSLEASERTAFIDEASVGDPALREELLSLLDHAEAAEQFFKRVSESVFSSSLSGDAGENPSGQVVDSELSEGYMAGHYRIMSLIDRGGMGSVYRAHDTRLGRDVALKFLPSYLGAEPEARERLLNEARAAASLDHRNVCSIHEIGETSDGHLFIAMPCYPGETLKERLKRCPLSVEESVANAIQIARGLNAAHSRGIIHRDIKPGNVMVGDDGTVRLLDFGLAMVIDASLANSGVTPGTVSYMSPEHAAGNAVDPRTDLWSLGVVLYEMLTGVRPFRGENANAVLHAISHADPDPISAQRPEVSSALAAIVERLLRKNQEARYQNAADVLADLERTLPSTPVAPQRFTARQRAFGASASVVLLGLVAVAGWRASHGESMFARYAAARALPSIAVLPLTNLSGDSADAALATGMTEELIATLASAGNIRVISSTSVAGFKPHDIDVRKIADSLGVSNIVEGGIQKIGSRVRVQVRLVNGEDGSTRWSQSYDREFNGVFAVQNEIARAVAGELELRFDRDRQFLRHHTQNMKAYELYLRGSDPVLLRSQTGIWKAQEFFQQAIAADSGYAAAHAGLSLVYLRRSRNASDPLMPVPALRGLAEAEARKAIALDGGLAEGHYALGRILETTLDFPSAQASIRRAIALDPSRSVYRRALSYLMAWTGRPGEELAEARRALETDPLNPYALAAVASGLYGEGHYDEALSQFLQLATLKPPLQGVSFAIAQCYAKKKMLPEAIAALRPNAEAGDPMFQALLGHMLARAGQRDEASRILTDLLARREKTGSGAFFVAVVQAGMNNRDETFAWLDKSIDDRSISSFIMGPTFDHLHADPRFQQIKKRLRI